MTTPAAAVRDGATSADGGILDRIIAQTRLSPDDEAYDIAKRGVSAFIAELLKPQNENEPVKKALVDRMIAEIDATLSQQVDEILHHPQFQALESAWRGLQLLVERTNFRESIKLEILNASKQDLLEDFEDFVVEETPMAGRARARRDGGAEPVDVDGDIDAGACGDAGGGGFWPQFADLTDGEDVVAHGAGGVIAFLGGGRDVADAERGDAGDVILFRRAAHGVAAGGHERCALSEPGRCAGARHLAVHQHGQDARRPQSPEI